MTKTLQQIKDEVSQEWGHTDWNDFGESFKHRLGSAHAERDEVVTEIAIRYAQERKRELVEMLRECEEWIGNCNQYAPILKRIEELITKHKQS